MRGTLLSGLVLAAVVTAAVPPGGVRADEAGGTCTGTPGEVKLYVNVEGVRSSQGLIAVTLYADNAKKFLAKRGSLYVGRVPAHEGMTRACIYVPKPGMYGIAVYHDADANRHLDRNALGMPQEAYGFSNNPGTFFGIPRFSSVRFPVRGPQAEIKVRLKYP
jgi:uncharacterized protein (DUF2141 family)